MPLTTGTRIGSYEVTSLLGKGGMGEVYRARDAKLDRDVAIKVLTPAFANNVDRLARFQREAKVLASLNHPNIATVYALEDTEHGKALVMELVEGSTAKGPMPVEKALKLALQVADAIEAAHDQGIVHRDIKPSNVMVTPQGNVKVLDFGLAAFTRSSGDGVGEDSPTLSLTMTEPGVILGTAAYMSPEQASGETVDRHADIWSFGVLLTELLTGERLFQGPTVAKVLANVINQPVDLAKLPADTPAPIRELIARCLEREVRDRLHAMGEARIAIQKWLANPRSDEPETPSQVGASAQPVRVWKIAAAGLALAASGLSVVAALHFREQPPEHQVLQYNVPIPERSGIQQVALSPDGHYVVFAVFGDRSQLFVRSLDSLQLQPLAGTEGAVYPFWSPDSRYIGFFADEKLKKIALTGGPTQTLCDARGTRGGTWSKDGVIVFSTTAGNSGLSRVPASGGVAVSITNPDGGSHRQPFFLPDGRRLLYVAFGGKEPGIYVQTLDEKGDVAKGNAGQPRKLALDPSAPRYVAPMGVNPNAHLLFVREQTLMAQPVDPSTLENRGDIFPIAERVARSVNAGNFLYSTSLSGMLAYASGGFSEVGGNRQLAWFDRSGKFLSNLGMPLAGPEFSLSRDGKRVAVAKGPPGSNVDLWTSDDHGVESRFTFVEGINRYPTWSSDGARIAFSSNRGGTPYDLYQKASNNAGQDELLFKSPIAKQAWGWSPDGKFLIYSQNVPQNKDDLWALPLNTEGGGERKPVPLVQSPFADWMGQVSPDGRWLAYVSDESKRPEVYVIPFSPGKVVSGKWQVSTAGGGQPRWRDDGKELFYAAPDRKLMVVAVTASASAFERTTPQPLFELRYNPEDSHFQYRYAPTPDGKRFLEMADSGAGSGNDLTTVTLVTNWLGAVKK